MGVLILDASHGRLDTIATLTSRQPRNGEPPNSLEITQISPGKITATDIYCQSTDANCCPSGKTTARWTYHNGTLTPDTP
ncbi:hypothetical protein ACIBL8_38945 [Streptomyces sp. NPDC050523]|uniref:hypothetical protein n=1 Tax=Streptomyces sp. NPDC050523 TaxID=3365622 RepID=UPI003799113B